MIAKYLSPKDLASLNQANYDLHYLLTPLLINLILDIKDEILVWAASRNRQAMVQFLLDNNASVTWRELEGARSAIDCAAKAGHVSIVEMLLRSGAVDCGSPRTRRRPIDFAAWGGHTTIVRMMLQYGAKVIRYENTQINGPLHWAAIRGHEPTIRLLLDHIRENEIDIAGVSGVTALHLAAASGSKSSLKLLLEKGADLHKVYHDGYGVLHFAAAAEAIDTDQRRILGITDFDSPRLRTPEQRAAAVGFLLRRGARVDTRCEQGRTPLIVAARYGHEAAARILLANGADHTARDKGSNTSLHVAAIFGHYTVVDLLLEAGADPGASNFEGAMPIGEAAIAGHVSVVARLLAAHGDAVLAPGGIGEIAFKFAAMGDSVAVIAFLLDKGVDVNARTYDGRTRLHDSAEDECEGDMAKLLLEKGADTTARDNQGDTPLHVAARNRYVLEDEENGHGSVGRLLVEHGADIEAIDKYGRTPLHLAAMAGRQMLVQFLLSKGADIAVQDSYSWTAFHWAVMARNIGVVTILLEAGADINHRIQQEKTILHEMASRGGRETSSSYSIWQIDWQGPWTSSPQRMEQWKKIIQLLLDKGIDSTATDVHGRTALSMAESRAWTVMVNILKAHNL